jgi:hypothetical protein
VVDTVDGAGLARWLISKNKPAITNARALREARRIVHPLYRYKTTIARKYTRHAGMVWPCVVGVGYMPMGEDFDKKNNTMVITVSRQIPSESDFVIFRILIISS